MTPLSSSGSIVTRRTRAVRLGSRALGVSLALVLLPTAAALGETPAEPAPSASEDLPEGACVGLTCEVKAEDAVDDADVATPLSPEPTEEEQSPILNRLVATVYEQAGLPRCPFEGLRRDDEADLAPIDIVRECDEDAEEDDEDAPPSWDEIVALISRE